MKYYKLNSLEKCNTHILVDISLNHLLIFIAKVRYRYRNLTFLNRKKTIKPTFHLLLVLETSYALAMKTSQMFK